jgi:DNA-binding response OmpR family regulator
MRVLYVEDETYLAEAVAHLVKKAGIMIDCAADGETGLDLALKSIYDVIVLDIMLPKLSGLDILKTLRTKNIKTPILMLSALGEVEHKIKGLDQGADDYLAKPFKTAELIARLNALARRPPALEAKTLSFADLVLDPTNHTLNSESLTTKETALMEILIKSAGTTLRKDHLLAKIWGSDLLADDNYVEVYISYLRKKLLKLNSSAKITTIRGFGYKLCS